MSYEASFAATALPAAVTKAASQHSWDSTLLCKLSITCRKLGVIPGPHAFSRSMQPHLLHYCCLSPSRIDQGVRWSSVQRPRSYTYDRVVSISYLLWGYCCSFLAKSAPDWKYPVIWVRPSQLESWTPCDMLQSSARSQLWWETSRRMVTALPTSTDSTRDFVAMTKLMSESLY